MHSSSWEIQQSSVLCEDRQHSTLNQVIHCEDVSRAPTRTGCCKHPLPSASRVTVSIIGSNFTAVRNASRANSKEQVDSESTTIQSIFSLACTGHASICTIVSVGPLPNLRHLRMIQSDSAAVLCCSASLLEAYCAPSAPTKRSHQGACAATKSLLGSSTASILAESAAQE